MICTNVVKVRNKLITSLATLLFACHSVHSVYKTAKPITYTLPQLLKTHPQVSVSFYPANSQCPECALYSRLFEEATREAPIVHGTSEVPEIMHPYTVFYVNGQMKRPVFNGPIEKLAVKAWLNNHLANIFGPFQNRPNQFSEVDTMSGASTKQLLAALKWKSMTDNIASAIHNLIKSKANPAMMIAKNSKGGLVSANAFNAGGDTFAASVFSGGDDAIPEPSSTGEQTRAEKRKVEKSKRKEEKSKRKEKKKARKEKKTEKTKSRKSKRNKNKKRKSKKSKGKTESKDGESAKKPADEEKPPKIKS